MTAAVENSLLEPDRFKLNSSPVTPAKAGVQGRATERFPWIPACAGMTIQSDANVL